MTKLRNRKVVIAAALLLALLAAQAVGIAAADTPPSVDIQSDHTTFTAGALQAIFEGNQPGIKFRLTTDSSNTEYSVRFIRIIEFNDTSGKGIPFESDWVKKAELEVTNWTPSISPLKQGSTTIGIAVNFNNTVPVENSNVKVPVTFIAKAYNTTQSMTINGTTFNLNTAEIKIDFIITNWPFGTEKNPRLALQVNLHSEQDTFELEEGTGSHTLSSPETSSTNEQELHQRNDVEQEMRFSGTVGTTGMIGFFRFVNAATVNGQSVPVLASYKGEREGGESELAVFLSYPQFTGTLIHDPSIGFTPAGIPLLYILIGGAAVVAIGVAVALRRTRPQIHMAGL